VTLANDIDKMLQDIDSGKKSPSTLKDARQTMPSQPLPRPGTVYTQPEGPRSGQIKYKDYEPSGGASPRGDLGALSEHERKMFFSNPIKDGNVYSSPKHLPMGKVRVECDDSPMKPLMKAGSSVYPEYCLPDHSGVKAGSMVGGHGKNARGTVAKVSQPAAVSQKGNSKSPLVNKRVKNV
jgi:hypothetical protein